MFNFLSPKAGHLSLCLFHKGREVNLSHFFSYMKGWSTAFQTNHWWDIFSVWGASEASAQTICFSRNLPWTNAIMGSTCTAWDPVKPEKVILTHGHHIMASTSIKNFHPHETVWYIQFHSAPLFYSFMQHLCLYWICSPLAMSFVYKLKGEFGKMTSYFWAEHVPLRLVWFVDLTNMLPFSRNPDHLSWKPLEVNVQSLSFSFIQ